MSRTTTTTTTTSSNKRKRDETTAEIDEKTSDRRKQRRWVEQTTGSTGRALTKNQEVAQMLGREALTADTELDEFDIGQYKEDARLIILLGKRNTGKTVWMYDFCYKNRNLWPYGLVVTKTKHNNFWQSIFPQHLIITRFDKRVIGDFMRAQETRVQQRSVNSRVLLLLDDMASDQVMRYANELTTLAYNGRHYNIDIIFATQDVVKATTGKAAPPPATTLTHKKQPCDVTQTYL